MTPWFFERQCVLNGPIFKFAQFHRPTICVVGLAAGGPAAPAPIANLLNRHRCLSMLRSLKGLFVTCAVIHTSDTHMLCDKRLHTVSSARISMP